MGYDWEPVTDLGGSFEASYASLARALDEPGLVSLMLRTQDPDEARRLPEALEGVRWGLERAQDRNLPGEERRAALETATRYHMVVQEMFLERGRRWKRERTAAQARGRLKRKVTPESVWDAVTAQLAEVQAKRLGWGQQAIYEEVAVKLRCKPRTVAYYWRKRTGPR